MTAPVLIDFMDNGEIKITTPGLKGASCKDKTKFLQEALGTTVSDTKTSNYYMAEVQVTQQTQVRRQ